MANYKKVPDPIAERERRDAMDVDLEAACISIRNSKHVKRSKNLLSKNPDGRLTKYWQKQFRTMFKKW